MNRIGTVNDASIDRQTTQLYLVRHCQSTGQAPDAPLTPLGFEQAEQLAAALHEHGVQRIVSSTFLRARQSIEPLGRALGMPIETDERLIERTLSTEDYDDWMERLQAAWADFDLVLPGGESSRQATSRALAALDDILRDGPLPAVVASHGNLISLLLHAFDGRPGYETWGRLTNPDLFAVIRHAADDGTPARWEATRIWPA